MWLITRLPETEDRDLRWDPRAHGESERTQPAIHIQVGGCPEVRCDLTVFLIGAQRQAIETCHARRNEAGRAPLAAAERDAELAAVGAAREATLDAQRRGPGKVSGLCESRMVGMSRRTNPSMPRSREEGSRRRARSRGSSTLIKCG